MPSSAASTRKRCCWPGTWSHDASSSGWSCTGAQRGHSHGGCMSGLGGASPQSLSIAVHTTSSSTTWSSLAAHTHALNSMLTRRRQYRCHRCPPSRHRSCLTRPTRLPKIASIIMLGLATDTTRPAARSSRCAGCACRAPGPARQSFPAARCVRSAWASPVAKRTRRGWTLCSCSQQTLR